MSISSLFITKEAELWLQLTWRWLAVPCQDLHDRRQSCGRCAWCQQCRGSLAFHSGVHRRGMLSGRFWHFKNSQGWDLDFWTNFRVIVPQKLFASCPEPNVFELFVSVFWLLRYRILTASSFKKQWIAATLSGHAWRSFITIQYC